MRTALLLTALLSMQTACTSVARRVGFDFGSGLAPIEIHDKGATSGTRPAIVIPREILDGWNFLYLHIDETEFALCLEGKRELDRVVITNFRLAHIISSNSSHIEYVPCNGDSYLGTAHNHPSNGYPGWDPCHQSALDNRSFNKDKKAYVDIIICGRDRFVWVLKDGAGPRLFQARAEDSK